MPAFLLSLREGLEAALIIGIVLGALRRFGRSDQARYVWFGVAAAGAASVAAALVLNAIGAEFEGAAAQIFEGVMMLLAAAVLTWMIFWMQSEGSRLKERLTADVAAATADPGRSNASLFLLAFLAVFREGIELALFLVAATFATTPLQTVIGALAGLAVAAALGYLMFRGALRLNVKMFFRVTSLLLIFFAAGMVAYGAHELVEAGVLPALLDPLYNVNPVLSDASGFGLVLKTLFGYNGNPALIETILYVAYFAAIWFALRARDVASRQTVASA